MKQDVNQLQGFSSHASPLCDLGAKGAGLPGSFCAVFILLVVMSPFNVYALDRQEADNIPHVDQKARDNFLEYLYAEHHKAFAIAPGGTWAWTAQESSAEQAERVALQRCQSNTRQTCTLYAVNDRLVFDRLAWSRLWRLDRQHRPGVTSGGLARGADFPNLVFKDAKGKPHQLSDFRGKPVLVHFWGSWCPPCMREMPSLLQLQQALKERHGNNINMVLLQVREPFSRSLKWAKQQAFARLPLYDSGVQSDTDSELHTASGEILHDRKLARAFPSSYVLDGKGRVLFVHTGPISNWLEYLPFFKDVIEQNKR